MTTILIGYARYSTDRQDLAAQRAALEGLGCVDSYRIHRTMAARVTTAA
ncbi:recombinase family protein [uncultured Methylobacterium sp.]